MRLAGVISLGNFELMLGEDADKSFGVVLYLKAIIKIISNTIRVTGDRVHLPDARVIL